MRGKETTIQERLRAIELYEAGWNQHEVAEQLDRPRSTIQSILKAHGIETRPQDRQAVRLSNAQLDEVRRLYENEGLCQREIATELGIGEGTVQYRLRVAGAKSQKARSMTNYWKRVRQ